MPDNAPTNTIDPGSFAQLLSELLRSNSAKETGVAGVRNIRKRFEKLGCNMRGLDLFLRLRNMEDGDREAMLLAALRYSRWAGLQMGETLDMFAEMRAAVEAARARAGRPDALLAADALELATLGGARALGLDGDVGSLGVGKRADLAIISLAGTSFVPWEDPVTAVVLGGAPHQVVETFVDGARTSEKGIEWHGLIDGARRARSRMLA